MQVTIRRGTQADARAAAELWLRARNAAAGVIPQPVHGDDDVREWFASHVVSTKEPWVAEDRAGTLVGVLVLDGAWLDVEPGDLPNACERWAVAESAVGAPLVVVAHPVSQ